MDTIRMNGGVPLRATPFVGKKMRKRRELDALVGMSRGAGKTAVCAKPNQDQLLSESSDEQDEYWRMENRTAYRSGCRAAMRRRCGAILNVLAVILTFGCVMITSIMLWLFLGVKEQSSFLQIQIARVITGNQGIPDALQKYNSQIMELQHNQSELSMRVNELVSQVVSTVNELDEIRKQVKQIQQFSRDARNVSEMLEWTRDNMEAINASLLLHQSTMDRLDKSLNLWESNVTTSPEESLSLLNNVPKAVLDSLSYQRLDELLNNSIAINTTLNTELEVIKKIQSEHSQSIEDLQKEMDLQAKLLEKTISENLHVNQTELPVVTLNATLDVIQEQERSNDTDNTHS